MRCGTGPTGLPPRRTLGARMKIYTRKGDDGTTGLLYGGRVRKDDPGPTAYGDVDEAQAAIVLLAKDLAAQGQIQMQDGREDEMVY